MTKFNVCDYAFAPVFFVVMAKTASEALAAVKEKHPKIIAPMVWPEEK